MAAPSEGSSLPSLTVSKPEQFQAALCGHLKALLAGLADGWPAGRDAKLTPEAEKAIGELLPKLPPALPAARPNATVNPPVGS